MLNWGCVVVAGGLVEEPLSSAIGTRRKALAVVGGRTCLERTLLAVKGAGLATCVTVSGNDVQPHVSFGKFVHESDRQIENARRAVIELGDVDAILFLPADSPFLTAEILAGFVASVEDRVSDSSRWLAAGLTLRSEFQKEFEKMEAKAINLKEGAFLTGALYAASPSGFRHAMDLIEKFANNRKSQFKMAMQLGPWTIAKFFLRQVRLAEAEETLGSLFECEAIIVAGCDPRMAVDIDTVADFQAVTEFARAGAAE